MDLIRLQEELAPATLDALLAHGWYRMRQHIFTTVSIQLTADGPDIPVIWARLRLADFTPCRRHRKLMRLCRSFTCTLHPAVITPEIEALYAAYYNAIDFDTGSTAASFLMENHGYNFFPARMWQVHDGDRLIAVGYFDEGITSAAGILNFYHPDYKKYSPGLWLYFETIRYAAVTGKTFFYPGYIASGYSKFDYKLLAGTEKMELWQPEQSRWMPYRTSLHQLHLG